MISKKIGSTQVSDNGGRLIGDFLLDVNEGDTEILIPLKFRRHKTFACYNNGIRIHNIVRVGDRITFPNYEVASGHIFTEVFSNSYF